MMGIPMWGWLLAAGLGMQYFGSKKDNPPTEQTHRNQLEQLQESMGMSADKLKEIGTTVEVR